MEVRVRADIYYCLIKLSDDLWPSQNPNHMQPKDEANKSASSFHLTFCQCKSLSVKSLFCFYSYSIHVIDLDEINSVYLRSPISLCQRCRWHVFRFACSHLVTNQFWIWLGPHVEVVWPLHGTLTETNTIIWSGLGHFWGLILGQYIEMIDSGWNNSI